MSFENPTHLRIGMSASLNGRDYRLVGRSVLGETEGGETYYWNEFNLKTPAGEEATLVYDATGQGTQWRIFTQFEPEYPMTAADAVTKEVGDSLNLTGDNVRVTFRGLSRVYQVEGQAPEGEGVGTAAEYFNAEAGGVMQVVSWTGDEVEFYDGQTLSAGMVAAAFKIPSAAPAPAGGRIFSLWAGSGSSHFNWKGVIQIGVVLVVLFLVFGRTLSCSTNYEGSVVRTVPAGPPPLAVGATGLVDGKNYRIAAHAVVEIAEVGAKWERHEYELADDYGSKWLLVCGDRPGAGNWLFLQWVAPLNAPTAAHWAARKLGEAIELDDFAGKVEAILRSTVEQADGGELTGLENGAVSYGLESVNASETLLARWNETDVQLYRGRMITAKKVTDCFAGGK